MEKKIKILHIDDNLHDRQLIKDALSEQKDYEIIEADSRDKFEKLIVKNDFDLVLSDFNILGFDGLQVLQAVKQVNPDLPVIIVTGTGSEEVAIQALKMGAADYVIKTVSHIRGLAPAINNVLELKKAQEEHKRAVSALHESEELFRTAFESAVIGVSLLSLDGKFISINNTLCNMLGYSREELLKMNFNDITHPDDVNIGNDILSQLISGELSSVIIEKRYLHKEGHIIWVNISAGIVRKPKDKSQYFVTYIQDISNRKKFEEQLVDAKDKAEESDRLKTSFLQNISHEIRTPMNAIVNFTEFLKDPDITAENRNQYCDIVTQSSNQLLSIITDIVHIASIEAGQEKITYQKVNLNATLYYLYNKYLQVAQKKNLSFNLKSLLSENDAIINTDEAKLSTILTNLIANAIKFTKKGFINYGYSIKNNFVEFFIEDSGIGISPEMLEVIFKRFRQVEISDNRQYGGSGLGLAISKAYVEMLGGSIWVDSESGKGSVFHFTIPYNKAVYENKSEKIHKSTTGTFANESAKNILIVEDEEFNFIVLQTFLTSDKYNIIRALDGKEAVEICNKNPMIDLVLMDIKIPKLNGYEATRQIKKMYPNLPIIAQTAYSAEMDKRNAADSGCDAFISKPFSREQLISLMNKHLFIDK
ncbi:MAG: response regulator [Bacteroidales bacterium]|nr:response regulator [Bacteroidales bacterium]